MGLALESVRLDEYLTRVFSAPVTVLALRSLGGREVDDPKGFGYGVPFEVECLVGGRPRALVVSRTRPAQGFGHDYPADRAWQALYGHRAYNDFPRHVRSVDVGFIRASGEMVSAADAQDFFQLVEKAEGRLYWLDLDRLLARHRSIRSTPSGPGRWPASSPRCTPPSGTSRRSTCAASASCSGTASA